MITNEQVKDFDRNGYVLARDVFSPEEIEILVHNIKSKEKDARSMADASGRSTNITLWKDLQDDVFGATAAHPRIVNSARALLQEDIYHWHSKVIIKKPEIGGAWEWHQDYGYWYNDGCLYPRMVSCMMALNDSTKKNGCLKVMPGSHLIGRMEHGRQGNQAGIDPARMAAVEKILPIEYVEAPAGSVIFFHCNTIHSSEANTSKLPRLSFFSCFNSFSNIPYGNMGHGKAVPLPLISDDAIMKYALTANV